MFRISRLAIAIIAVACLVPAASCNGSNGCLPETHPPVLKDEVPNGIFFIGGAVGAGGGAGGSLGAGGASNNCECVAANNEGPDSPCAACFLDAISANGACSAQEMACTSDGSGGAGSATCSSIVQCVSAAGDDPTSEQACFLPQTADTAHLDYFAVLACACAQCGSKCVYTKSVVTCGTGTGGAGGTASASSSSASSSSTGP